jgi:hypothetical protein
MTQTLACVAQAGSDVFRLEVGQLFQNLSRRKAGGQQLQHVDNADAHSADAWLAAALFRVDRYSFREPSHGKGKIPLRRLAG